MSTREKGYPIVPVRGLPDLMENWRGPVIITPGEGADYKGGNTFWGTVIYPASEKDSRGERSHYQVIVGGVEATPKKTSVDNIFLNIHREEVRDRIVRVYPDLAPLRDRKEELYTEVMSKRMSCTEVDATAQVRVIELLNQIKDEIKPWCIGCGVIDEVHLDGLCIHCGEEVILVVGQRSIKLLESLMENLLSNK